MIPTNPKFAKFLPNGTILFILANRDSIVFDYNTKTAKPLAPPAPFHASLAKMVPFIQLPLLSAIQFVSGGDHGLWKRLLESVSTIRTPCSSVCCRIMVAALVEGQCIYNNNASSPT
jgi:hypothetical protein